MMLGPMKKKVIQASIVAFLIPTLILGAVLFLFSKAKNNEIKELEVKVAEGYAYAVSGDFPIGYVLTTDDVKVVDVKGVSVPADSYYLEKTEDDILQTATLLSLKNQIVGRKLRLSVADTTMITDSLFFEDEDKLDIDIRAKEFNMITLPSDLVKGDFLDIRILFPTGEDYLVTAGKEVMSTGSGVDSNSIVLNLGEEEIVRISSAIIESYMNSGVKLYAVKYVNPYQQLYSETSDNYVKKYQEALYTIINERTTEETVIEKVTEQVKISNSQKTSGDVSGDASGDVSGDVQTITKDVARLVKKVPTEDEISVEDVVALANIPLEDAKIIRKALKDNDDILLAKYRTKTIRIPTELVENYPVKAEVAILVRSNPNIIDELKARYNVEELMKQRENIVTLPLYEYDINTGTVAETDTLTQIAEKIESEIETQRAERKRYLQSLIGAMPTL